MGGPAVWRGVQEQPMAAYITRQKAGKAFRYFDGTTQITDRAVLAHIETLAIPPAWQHVEIAKAKSARIQAHGYDAAGRKQYIYHPVYRQKQEKLKFDRTLRFAESLPRLRRQVDKDLRHQRLDKDKVLAFIVRLIDEAYFRVGNDRYTREHQTYGITTLQSKHVDITTTVVTFDFIGKSGKEQIKRIVDPQLARILKQLDELPGREIFRYTDRDGGIHDLNATDVNNYIKRHMGEEFTAKDFRTWGGTLLATSTMLHDKQEPPTSATARKKAVAAVVKQVAARLGNTPAVARASYIHPTVLAAYEDRETIVKLRAAMLRIKPKRYRSIDEESALWLLKR